MPSDETFAGRLVQLRGERGWTPYRLAQLTGLTKQAILNLERGTEPTWRTVRLLAAALGVPVTAFEVGSVELPEAKPPGKPGRKPKALPEGLHEQPPALTDEDETALDTAADRVGQMMDERRKAATGPGDGPAPEEGAKPRKAGRRPAKGPGEAGAQAKKGKEK